MGEDSFSDLKNKGWEKGWVAKHLPSIWEALDSISSAAKRKRKEKLHF